jgi:hypothetical protein
MASLQGKEALPSAAGPGLPTPEVVSSSPSDLPALKEGTATADIPSPLERARATANRIRPRTASNSSSLSYPTSVAQLTELKQLPTWEAFKAAQASALGNASTEATTADPPAVTTGNDATKGIEALSMPPPPLPPRSRSTTRGSLATGKETKRRVDQRKVTKEATLNLDQLEPRRTLSAGSSNSSTEAPPPRRGLAPRPTATSRRTT